MLCVKTKPVSGTTYYARISSNTFKRDARTYNPSTKPKGGKKVQLISQ